MANTGAPNALTLQSGYSAIGDVPALRRTAKGAVPVIRRHWEQAQALHSRGM